MLVLLITSWYSVISEGRHKFKSHVTLFLYGFAAPGPPTLEDCHAEDFTIIVTWKEPVKKNGVISNYMVEWKDWNDYVNSTVTDANTFSYEIVLNSCGGKVDVTVSAKTADFDGFGKRSQPESVFLVNSSECFRRRSRVLRMLIQALGDE